MSDEARKYYDDRTRGATCGTPDLCDVCNSTVLHRIQRMKEVSRKRQSERENTTAKTSAELAGKKRSRGYGTQRWRPEITATKILSLGTDASSTARSTERLRRTLADQTTQPRCSTRNISVVGKQRVSRDQSRVNMYFADLFDIAPSALCIADGHFIRCNDIGEFLRRVVAGQGKKTVTWSL